MKNLQEQLFDIILARYPRRSDAVDDLCHLLNCSKDPLYRRMRGDTVITPEEMQILAKHYRISLDALVFGQSDNVVCSFNAFSRRIMDFSDYLGYLIGDLEQIHRLPGAHMRYATAEVPIFTYMYFPELISFKLYVWGRTTWDMEYLNNRPFDFDLATPAMMRQAHEVLDLYNALNSTELWSMSVADTTLAQIEYHLMIGGFRNDRDAILLCDKLVVWAEHMRAVATAGKKFRLGSTPLPNDQQKGGNIELFHNEMVYTNNVVMIDSDLGKAIYAAFSNPNFLKSTDQQLCEYMEKWFHSLIGKSTILSLSAEKNREWFFKGMLKKIDTVRARIVRRIEENEGN